MLDFDQRPFIGNNTDFVIRSYSTSEPMATGLHEHNFAELFLLISGSATYTIEQGKFELKEYDFILIPPHTLHQVTVKDDAKYQRIILWIYPQFLSKLSSEITDLNSELFRYANHGYYLVRDVEFAFKIKSSYEKILYLQESKPFAYDILTNMEIMQIFIMLNEYLKEKNEQVESAVGNPIVLKIINYIEKNIAKELSLKEIADYVGLDSFYISRIFSKEVGTTIHKYIIKKRLNQVKKLLDQDYPIKEIITIVGFKDESHFIQAFRKEYGTTPKKYRKEMPVESLQKTSD